MKSSKTEHSLSGFQFKAKAQEEGENNQGNDASDDDQTYL